MKDRIAIQGIQGSFHHQVASEYFGKHTVVLECDTFQELAESLSSGKSSGAVMAIENSIAGSILPNYALIDEYDLQVEGEHCIPIDLNLLAVPGQDISGLRKVYSHPMALLQCKNFFRDYPRIKLIEDSDTAGAAQRIADKSRPGIGAVASKAAASLYGLEIMAEGIHSLKMNFTRFLILRKTGQSVDSSVDKASLKFELLNKPGSLSEILDILRNFDLDMSKIQSLPVPGTPWKYAFFIDVNFKHIAQFHKTLAVLKLKTEELKVFGTYKNNMI